MSAPLATIGQAEDAGGHQDPTRGLLMYAALAGIGGLAGYLISGTRSGAMIGAAVPVAWEAGWWLRRVQLRESTFRLARAHADRLGMPLVVVGAPDRGLRTKMCGDVTVDIAPSSACANFVQADVTRPGSIPLPDDSAVVFVPYVLEYVSDLDAAVREIRRVGGDRVYNLRVEPWTATAYVFKGARRTVPSDIFGAPERRLP